MRPERNRLTWALPLLVMAGTAACIGAAAERLLRGAHMEEPAAMVQGQASRSLTGGAHAPHHNHVELGYPTPTPTRRAQFLIPGKG